MNQKLIFVSIIAIVAAFAVSTAIAGLGFGSAFAKTNCQNKGLVAANVCGTQACVDANVLTGTAISQCKNSQ